ncbi:transposable element Tcb2 transposase [Trichonephila clavipes]|nr:transposable element Tcb2 transposase [Trichonephila clavipes]
MRIYRNIVKGSTLQLNELSGCKQENSSSFNQGVMGMMERDKNKEARCLITELDDELFMNINYIVCSYKRTAKDVVQLKLLSANRWERKIQFNGWHRGDSYFPYSDSKLVKYHRSLLNKTVKHPTNIMIWSVISGKGLDVVKGMMRQDQYKDVLQNRLIPQLEEWFPNGESCIFMQDGAPCHTAWSIKAFLAEQIILLLDWPGDSPDMNTIENVWELMKREVAKDVITNKTQLLERIIHVGNHHPQMQETVLFCIDSMSRRIEALIAAKGDTSKY